MLQKWSFNLQSICRKTFWTFKNRPLSFSKFEGTEKVQNLFFFAKYCPFFNKLVLHQPLRSFRKKLITRTINVERLFGPYKLFSDFCHVRYYEKKWATRCYSLESLPFSTQNFVFQQHFRPLRNDLATCKMIVKTICGTLKFLACCLSYS